MLKVDIRNDLLARARLSDKEAKSRYALAVRPSYWRELCPHVPLDSSRALVEPRTRYRQKVEYYANQLNRFGYFKTEPLIPKQAVASMRQCVEAVRRAGWPPVFAFLYDPFWAVTRNPFMVEFLGAVLGAEFNIIMSRSWCYYIPPSRGAGGWTPHADAYSKPANRLTVWIPLTEATLDNGCIYVVPKDFAYGSRAPRNERLRAETVSSDYALTLLHSCRALPAAAGSVLGWILRPSIGARGVMCRRNRVSASDVSLSAKASCPGLTGETSSSPASLRNLSLLSPSDFVMWRCRSESTIDVISRPVSSSNWPKHS